ncbi:unnamed protein product [Peronospora destructor]|uniref:DUF3752 domain-containing protein n=1 Tax=Peronospora destructor TaxID=86335 RepID=A0AAV0U0L5_9STRA|nr:unnamed protein product [Peronospora destructor]
MGKHERDRDSSLLNERRKRHKRQHDNDKKKTKKSKKHKDKSRKSHWRHKRSHHSDSDSASDTPSPDYKRAMKIVQELLTETPEISEDLLQLFQMVDDGEVAVTGDIENRRIRSKLKELFSLLGLHKLREPKDAFAKPRKGKDNAAESLMAVFRKMLAGDTKEPAPTLGTGDDNEILPTEVVEPARKKPMKRKLPIGPALPPASAKVGGSDVQDDDDDEVVGPSLPGMKGFRLADERLKSEMARKAKQLEKEQWQRARDGDKSTMVEVDRKKPLVREAWMMMMPESSILKDSLGPQNRPPPDKPTAFRSKEPAAMDKTWFDAPEERERAKRAKLDMELLGYVRKENAPSDTTASVMTFTIAPTTVNESILPNVNPEADEAMRKQMENLRKARGPSLLEQHQRKQAKHADDGVSTTQSSGGWNRDRDLTARRGMSGDDAERMITAAQQINSKFTAPTISRQFL